MLSDPVLTTIITGVFSTIALIPVTITSIINFKQGKRNEGKVNEAAISATAAKEQASNLDKKADALMEKTSEIHGLTNGRLATALAALEEANKRIVELEKQLLLVMARPVVAAPTSATY